MNITPVTVTEEKLIGVTITLSRDEAEHLRQTLGNAPANNLNCDLWEMLCEVLRP